MRKQERGRVRLVAGFDTDTILTQPSAEVFARTVDARTDHSHLYATELGRERPDVVVFGGHVDPSAAERKIRVSWPGSAEGGTGPKSLDIDGAIVTLGQLEQLAESLAAIVRECRKWRAR